MYLSLSLFIIEYYNGSCSMELMTDILPLYDLNAAQVMLFFS